MISGTHKTRFDKDKQDDLTAASRPFFSVIIPTYNRVQLLKRALNSLIAQHESDWEAIIIDDESTDDTYAQLLPYLRLYSKIKYIKKNHSGEALTKNAGIVASTGKFITFLDSDDEYDPTHLESRKKILIQNPSLRFLSGGVKVIGNQYVPDRYNEAKKINLSKCVIGGSFFIERNTLISLEGFSEILLGPDADLFDRAKKAGIIMVKTTLKTYIYHHETMDSITNKLYLEQQSALETRKSTV